MKPLRDVFGEALVELGEKNPDVFVLDADLAGATRSIFFGDRFPERFFNVGITEANMVSIGAGLASCGKIPYVCTFSFLLSLRALDQIRSQICYPRLNVKLMGTNAGLSGFGDGATHQCVLDLAIMRSLPGMTVVVPSDEQTMRQAVLASIEHEGPLFLRIPREGGPEVHKNRVEFEIGRGLALRQGEDVSIIAMGLMVSKALEAAQHLESQGIKAQVLEIHTLKPLDRELILQCVSETNAVVVVEEHSRYGGLGSAVSEVLGEEFPAPFEFVAIEDRFGESGQYEEILASCGLTVQNIVARAKAVLKRKARRE
jgi:transketolase